MFQAWGIYSEPHQYRFNIGNCTISIKLISFVSLNNITVFLWSSTRFTIGNQTFINYNLCWKLLIGAIPGNEVEYGVIHKWKWENWRCVQFIIFKTFSFLITDPVDLRDDSDSKSSTGLPSRPAQVHQAPCFRAEGSRPHSRGPQSAKYAGPTPAPASYYSSLPRGGNNTAYRTWGSEYGSSQQFKFWERRARGCNRSWRRHTPPLGRDSPI